MHAGKTLNVGPEQLPDYQPSVEGSYTTVAAKGGVTLRLLASHNNAKLKHSGSWHQCSMPSQPMQNRRVASSLNTWAMHSTPAAAGMMSAAVPGTRINAWWQPLSTRSGNTAAYDVGAAYHHNTAATPGGKFHQRAAAAQPKLACMQHTCINNAECLVATPINA
jgi:hypothetical protein